MIYEIRFYTGDLWSPKIQVGMLLAYMVPCGARILVFVYRYDMPVGGGDCNVTLFGHVQSNGVNMGNTKNCNASPLLICYSSL